MYMYCQCSDLPKIIDKITQYTFFWSFINFYRSRKNICDCIMAWCCYHWFHHLYVDKMVSVQLQLFLLTDPSEYFAQW